METKPTHEQAQLHLQMYNLRREAKLRQARDWFFQNYRAETFEDAMRIAAPRTESGAFAGMVMGSPDAHVPDATCDPSRYAA